MDDIELTQLFVDYASLSKKLAELKAQIEIEVLLRGESVKIAGVTATYYKLSFGTPDYEKAAKENMPPDFDLLPYSTITTSVKWKEVCEVLKVEAPVGEEKPARVAVK